MGMENHGTSQVRDLFLSFVLMLIYTSLEVLLIAFVSALSCLSTFLSSSLVGNRDVFLYTLRYLKLFDVSHSIKRVVCLFVL